jgi:hypothetical protein
MFGSPSTSQLNSARAAAPFHLLFAARYFLNYLLPNQGGMYMLISLSSKESKVGWMVGWNGLVACRNRVDRVRTIPLESPSAQPPTHFLSPSSGKTLSSATIRSRKLEIFIARNIQEEQSNRAQKQAAFPILSQKARCAEARLGIRRFDFCSWDRARALLPALV